MSVDSGIHMASVLRGAGVVAIIVSIIAGIILLATGTAAGLGTGLILTGGIGSLYYFD